MKRVIISGDRHIFRRYRLRCEEYGWTPSLDGLAAYIRELRDERYKKWRT